MARIGAAHGLKGEVRLWSFTQDPRAVRNYGPLESENGARSFTIKGLRAAKDHFVAKLSGIDNRDAAEALNNIELYIARDKLPPAAQDEFYHADLVGLAAVATDGTELGEIVAVQNFGAGDILEIRLKANGETVMLPFTESIAPVIDIAAGRIVIDAPEGALDPATEEPK